MSGIDVLLAQLCDGELTELAAERLVLSEVEVSRSQVEVLPRPPLALYFLVGLR